MNKEQKTMDPSRYPSYTEEDSAASGRRLNEILKVLKKHHLTSGLTPVKLREILEDLGPTYVHAFRYAPGSILSGTDKASYRCDPHAI